MHCAPVYIQPLQGCAVSIIITHGLPPTAIQIKAFQALLYIVDNSTFLFPGEWLHECYLLIISVRYRDTLINVAFLLFSYLYSYSHSHSQGVTLRLGMTPFEGLNTITAAANTKPRKGLNTNSRGCNPQVFETFKLS